MSEHMAEVSRFACRACSWTGDSAHSAIAHSSMGYQHVTYLRPEADNPPEND